jgi:hypothetical protein
VRKSVLLETDRVLIPFAGCFSEKVERRRQSFGSNDALSMSEVHENESWIANEKDDMEEVEYSNGVTLSD